MRFDASLRDAWIQDGETWHVDVPTGWGQGRTIYGGLMAAAATALGYRNVDADWQLRTLNVQFVQPSKPGRLVGRCTPWRRGKGVSFLQVELLQAEAVVLVAQLVFARPRISVVDVAPPKMRAAKPCAELSDLPYLPGMTPEFTQHLALRWADGGYPFSGADAAAFTGYCRFRQPAGDAEGTVALLDAWPCPTLALAKGPAASSSVMWTAHLIHTPAPSDAWYGFEYDTVVGHSGLHTAVGRMFDADGRLVGWTEQLVTVYV
jgi:acyl-CoA hydrolase